MLEAFPPIETINSDILAKAGVNYVFSSANLTKTNSARQPRGRPSFQWQDFQIEIARMFRDGEFPEKKEAAIAHLQQWFERQHAKSVGRSTIGERLKPYYDALVRK